MLERWAAVFLCGLATVGIVSGEPNFPQAEISNGIARARVYLPNPEQGYYRGSRFDWSGVVANLYYAGHNYFGVWFPRYDPRLHDSISGPVEEFRTPDGAQGGALGYDEAKPGGSFVKIGVGVLRKPDDKPYTFSRSYDIVNPGKWTSRPESDRVEFQQELTDEIGYGYRYQKVVRLASKRPELILEHRLKNTGKRVIETDVYDHDFFVIDGMPTGPDFVVKFAFPPKPMSSFKNLAEIRGNELVYLKTLEGRESAASELTGFSDSSKDNDFRVENAKVGAGVHETGDHPIARLIFWSIRTTLCPEGYIRLRIAPGQEARWKIRYEFYTLPKQPSR